MHRLSASQVETFRLCARKWAFAYLDGVRSAPADSARLGTRVHEILEAYAIDGTRPDLSETFDGESRGKVTRYWPGQIATSGLHLLPAPGVMRVEGAFKFETEIGPWGGRLDGEYVDHRGALTILDHKTTSDRKWTKDLTADVQCNLYSHAKLLEHPDLDAIEARWIYYLTSGSRRDAWAVERRMTRSHVAEQMGAIHATAAQIHRLYEIRPKALDVPPTLSACEAYGGCPHRDTCGASQSVTDLIFTEDKMDDLSAFLDAEEAKKKALSGVPPLPGSKPAAPAVPVAAPPLPSGGVWQPGDPLNAAQQYLLGGATPRTWLMIASAADNPPSIEVAAQYDLQYLPGLPLRPRPDAGVINPPEAPRLPVASPAEMPPVPPVAGKAEDTGDRRALKARAIELGLVDASSKLGAAALAKMIETAEGTKAEIKQAIETEIKRPSQVTPPKDFVLLVNGSEPVSPVPVSPVPVSPEPVSPAPASPEPGDLFALYVNCIPDFEHITLDEILSNILPVFREKEGVADYRLMEYGRGPGVLVAYLAAYLTHPGTFLNPGLPAIVVDTRTPEGAVCLSTLARYAQFVVRGF